MSNLGPKRREKTREQRVFYSDQDSTTLKPSSSLAKTGFWSNEAQNPGRTNLERGNNEKIIEFEQENGHTKVILC